VRGVLAERAEAEAANVDPVLLPALDELTARDVERAVAVEVLAEVREALSGQELKSPEARAEAVVGALARRLPVASEQEPRARPRVVAFVGPTGAGKTTTAAKLAAAFSLGEGKKVALVSADSFRVGSSEQIKMLGSLLDVPVTTALAPDDLREAVARASDADVVLVDTAGRNYMQRLRTNELKLLLDAVPGAETYLVISATRRRSALRAAGERFGVCRPRGVVVTKLDESPCLGGLVDVPRAVGLGFAYVAWGQDISKGIERAEAMWLARMVTGRESVSEAQPSAGAAL
jgi:flagellar biosynthesis protein FlhF